MQQRYYDPIAGRFLSPDPIATNPSNGANFNRYAYANNNPYRYIDPDGRASVYNYPDEHSLRIVQTFSGNDTHIPDEEISGANLSGRASDGTKIIVELARGSDSDAIRIKLNSKLDDTSADPRDRSHMNRIGGRKMEIAPNARASTVEHEIAHGLRAGDQYKGGLDKRGRKLDSDVAGPRNLMKNGTGPANQQTIDEIRDGARAKSNTQYECHTTEVGVVCK